MISTNPLPDDPALLKAMVSAQQAQLASHEAEIERLNLIIAKLRRMQFGQSSEQLEATLGELELSLEELETVRAEQEQAAPQRWTLPDQDPSVRR